MQTLEERILSQLECPSCYKYMSAPIRVCSKGHSCCDQCVRKYSTCMWCSYPFLTTRNLGLEALVYEIGIKCNDCQKNYTSDIFYTHECSTDNQNKYKCRIEIIEENYSKKNCRWYGEIYDVKNHFEEFHKSNCFTLNEGRIFKWTLPYEQDQENISTIKLSNSTFLQEVYYENRTRKLYFAVYNLNPVRNKNYRYKIVTKKNKQKKQSIRNVFNDYVNIQKLMRTDDMIRIDIDVFDMTKDREINWILEIYDV